jgi:hypothetical protein
MPISLAKTATMPVKITAYSNRPSPIPDQPWTATISLVSLRGSWIIAWHR